MTLVPVPIADKRFAMVTASLAWLVISGVLLALYWSAIPQLAMRDVDDALRLLQVRDLLAGQGWHDFTQYRINAAGGGGAMHWSRLVDLPLVALIALLSPLVGTAVADRVASALVPLLLLCPLLLVMGAIAARLGGRAMVLACLAAMGSAVTLLHYFVPLRIDHHGWQLLLAALLLLLSLGAPGWRRGLAAALIVTVYLEISLEALPLLAVFGGLYAAEWVLTPQARGRLLGFSTGLALFPLVWLMLMRGPASVFTVQCDSFSLPWWLATSVTGAGVAAALGLAPAYMARSFTMRVAALALAGAAGASVLAMTGGACANGPFGDLSPLVRTLWYDKVLEGQPLWRQKGLIALMLLTPTLAGLGATSWAAWRARGGPAGPDWLRLLWAGVGAALLSLFVMRTAAIAHYFLVPGLAAALVAMVGWAQARPQAGLRILTTTGSIVLLPVVLAGLGFQTGKWIAAEPTSTAAANDCGGDIRLSGLSRAPAIRIFSAIDMAPWILLHSPHNVIATGHHRNHRAMHQILTGFTASPDAAERVVRASGAALVALCTDLPESEALADYAPDGLAAQLVAGRVPGWLAAAPDLSRGTFQVYRVRAAQDQASLNSSAAPFMQ